MCCEAMLCSTKKYFIVILEVMLLIKYYSRIIQVLFKYHEILWNSMEFYGILWNAIECYNVLWNTMKCYECSYESIMEVSFYIIHHYSRLL